MRDKNRVNKTVVKKMIGYCENVEELIKRFGPGYEKFVSDFAFQMACGMCIIQIGELTTRLTDDFKEAHPEIEWKPIKAVRNIFVHDYEETDFNIVWDALTKEIPDLKEKLQKILAEMI